MDNVYRYNEEEKRKLRNLQRRVNRARDFPLHTCPASRHLQMMADSLARGADYPMFYEEPEHCAETMYAVLESLWKARKTLSNQSPPNA